jgi:hypothetical protein
MYSGKSGTETGCPPCPSVCTLPPHHSFMLCHVSSGGVGGWTRGPFETEFRRDTVSCRSNTNKRNFVCTRYVAVLTTYTISPYSSRDQTVCFSRLTSLVECKQKILPIYELTLRGTKYCRWEIMFIFWMVSVSLSCTPSAPLTPLPHEVPGTEAHRLHFTISSTRTEARLGKFQRGLHDCDMHTEFAGLIWMKCLLC